MGKSHHYQFNYDDIIHRAENGESLIEDEHILISIINSSLLSYQIDNSIPLDFYGDDTKFNQILYKYKASLTNPQKRRLLNDEHYYDYNDINNDNDDDENEYYSIDEAAAYLNDYIYMDDDEQF